MRTAIFVHEPAMVEFVINESNLLLCKMDPVTTTPLSGTVELQLSKGIYKVVSTQHVGVNAGEGLITVGFITDDKDPWPELPPGFAASFGVTASQVIDFFTEASGKGSRPSIADALQ